LLAPQGILAWIRLWLDPGYQKALSNDQGSPDKQSILATAIRTEDSLEIFLLMKQISMNRRSAQICLAPESTLDYLE
jgi:hypothetical protein